MLEGGILYRIWVDVSGKRRKDVAVRLIAVPQKHKAAVLAVALDSPFSGGHFGCAKTLANLKLLLARHDQLCPVVLPNERPMPAP